jgi:hypothetical protein
MTSSQHHTIGAILGFPPCCVEHWIDSLDDDSPPAAARGAMIGRTRRATEKALLTLAIQQNAGRPDWKPDYCDVRMWVPCPTHAQQAIQTGQAAGATWRVWSEL